MTYIMLAICHVIFFLWGIYENKSAVSLEQPIFLHLSWRCRAYLSLHCEIWSVIAISAMNRANLIRFLFNFESDFRNLRKPPNKFNNDRERNERTGHYWMLMVRKWNWRAATLCSLIFFSYLQELKLCKTCICNC